MITHIKLLNMRFVWNYVSCIRRSKIENHVPFMFVWLFGQGSFPWSWRTAVKNDLTSDYCTPIQMRPVSMCSHMFPITGANCSEMPPPPSWWGGGLWHGPWALVTTAGTIAADKRSHQHFARGFAWRIGAHLLFANSNFLTNHLNFEHHSRSSPGFKSATLWLPVAGETSATQKLRRKVLQPLQAVIGTVNPADKEVISRSRGAPTMCWTKCTLLCSGCNSKHQVRDLLWSTMKGRSIKNVLYPVFKR